jgi:DNA polymerase III delta prime subunit
MNQTLFIHKYQPKLLKDFEIDSELTNILQISISLDNLNILFVGNMGSGKTSMLNALIREYYALTDNKQYNDNILYINSLKEQGIHYYRNDVKTFCQTASSIKGKKKFVVLDDLDQINEQSQQVFRNCIDKYSHNVHFIASCSNVQKVIESLQSRYNIIKINSLERKDLMKIMNTITENEGIMIDDDAREFILDICNNIVKILINYIEKFKLLHRPITLELVKSTCTNINFITLEEYTVLVKDNRLTDAIDIIYSIYDKGYSVMDILDNYFLFIKMTSLLNEDEKYKVIPYICKYITIFHNVHEDEMELALFTNNIIEELKK